MATDQSPAYLDLSLPVERRVDDLLDRMTIEEKVAQLGSIKITDLMDDKEFDPELARETLEHGTGGITRIGGEGGFQPERAAEIANEIGRILDDTRLGIPAYTHEECLSGYMGPVGTSFPQSIGMASTWSPDLMAEVTTEIRRQLGAMGTWHVLSPVLDLARDHRWGRTEETFGEDRYLAARMACSYVDGIQGADPTDGLSATLKHFVAHGAARDGKNRGSVSLGPRELAQHAFPFQAAIREADAEAVMNAYHDLDGVPCGASEQLLTDLLRERWGFDGVVVADYGTVTKFEDEHGITESDREGAILALEAGIDLELPSFDTYRTLTGAVRDGEIAEETVDRSVRRILRTKFQKGMFEADPVDPGAVDEVFETDDQRELARRAARESVTLLEDDGALPIEDANSVAVTGPKATATEGLLGDYAYLAHFPELQDEEAGIDIVTALEAFEDRLGADAVEYEQGCTVSGPDTDGIDDAVATAEGADVAVAFVGANSTIDFSDADAEKAQQSELSTSGEGRDVTDLGLPGVQEQLVTELGETDTPLVVVVVSGKPHALEPVADAATALVHAWLPGEEGGNGIADVLLGEHAPAGRLPVSLPRNAGQLPIHYNRRRNSRNFDYVYTEEDPLYPFGHGESYAEFEYGDLELSSGETGAAGTVEASVTVENSGNRAAHETVQLYVRDVNPPIARPVQQLQGFERVHLEPGESARVTFEVGASQLAFLDRNEELAVHPGEYELRVGRSSADLRESATVEVVGEKREVPSGARRFFSETGAER